MKVFLERDADRGDSDLKKKEKKDSRMLRIEMRRSLLPAFSPSLRESQLSLCPPPLFLTLLITPPLRGVDPLSTYRF